MACDTVETLKGMVRHALCPALAPKPWPERAIMDAYPATNTHTLTRTQDALAVLKQDHHEIELLFLQCERQRGSSALDQSDLARHICRELIVHGEMEKRVFHPALRQAGVESQMLDDAVQEHTEVGRLIAQIESTSGYDAFELLQRLMSAVRHHVQEEEMDMFAAARDCGIDLEQLGTRLTETKQRLKRQLQG